MKLGLLEQAIYYLESTLLIILLYILYLYIVSMRRKSLMNSDEYSIKKNISAYTNFHATETKNKMSGSDYILLLNNVIFFRCILNAMIPSVIF